MKLTIQARNMAVTPGITQRIERKTTRMSKYLLPDTEMQIKMRKEMWPRMRSSISTVSSSGIRKRTVQSLRSESAAEGNLFAAIDDALTKMERQIHRHRTKLSKRLRDDAFAAEPEFIEEDETEGVLEVVRRKTFPVRPMSVEDAAIQMELLEHSFFAFVNIETERINVLYQRKDGGLGLLEPEA